MKTTSSRHQINKPEVSLEGLSGSVPVNGFSVQMAVGQMTRARITIPQEFLGEFMSASMDQEVQLLVDGDPIMVGYIAGPSTEISGESFSTGVNLVHKARDLDDGSLFSPGLHPMSTEDYGFSMAYPTANSNPTLSNRQFVFDLSANIGEEIPKYISKMMEETTRKSKSRSLMANKNLEYIGEKVASASPNVIEALKRLTTDGACEISGTDSVLPLLQSATSFATKAVTSAMQGSQSAWNLLAGMFSVFGMTIVCKPNGEAMVCPDYSGCKPDDGNTLEEDIVSRFSLSSQKIRTPSGVIAISYGISGGATNAPEKSSTSAVASYFPKGEVPNGGTYVTGLPGWMIPVVRSGGSEIPSIPAELASLWAKQIFHQVSNAGRSMSATVPFAPSALPGTTYKVYPASSAKFFSGGSTGLGSSYSGYCHSIVHSMRADSNGIQTSMEFRNVFPEEQEDGMIDGAPLLKEKKPFSV